MVNFTKNFRATYQSFYYSYDGVRNMNKNFEQTLISEAEKALKKAIAGEKLTKEEVELILFVNNLSTKNKSFDLSSITPLLSTLIGGIL